MNTLLKTEINKAFDCLKKDGSLLYPTDTVWGLGCAANSEIGIKKIVTIKQRPPEKSFIVLVHNLALLEKYVGPIPENIQPFLATTERPTTIIYPKAVNLPKALLAQDGSIGIRMVQVPFCAQLIEQLGEGLVSSSANISGEPTPKTFEAISPKVKSQVDYVVEASLFTDSEESQPSRIIRIRPTGEVDILRE